MAPVLFGQTHAACDLVTQAEADALLGGSARQIPVGKLGCGYSLRSAGLNLSITVMIWAPPPSRPGMDEESGRQRALAGGR